MATHVMLDLETAGTRVTSAIRSIGAVVFDPYSGDPGSVPTPGRPGTFYRNVSLRDAIQEGFTTDDRTMAWWAEQPQEARDALENPKPVTVKTALRDFSEWCERHAKGSDFLVLWCHATFDAPILGYAYDLLGREAPWRFYNVVDLRTYARVKVGASTLSRVDNVPTEGLHRADYDAYRQAIAVIVVGPMVEPRPW